MRLPEEPGFPVLPPGQPTRDLLLAQALDACIAAERRVPGSSQEIIARQPAWARGDLQRLVGLAGSLDAAASNAVMSSEFRVAARARLMRRIGGDVTPAPRQAPSGVVRLTSVSASRPHLAPVVTRPRLVRAISGLLAAVLAAAATLTASASALPGDPLYGLKQAQEELGVRLAPDDEHRALALLRQADARLGETTRLLEQGRTLDASATTLRYDQVVQRATMSYVATIDDAPAPAPASATMETSLSQDQEQLQALLQSAPEPARADLREALVATERGRALVADPRPVERALGRADRDDAALAAAVPTLAAEDLPAVAPTEPPLEAPTAIANRLTVPVAPRATPAVVAADTQEDAAGGSERTTPVMAQTTGADGAPGGDRTVRGGPMQPARSAPQGRGFIKQPGEETSVLRDVALDTRGASAEADGHSNAGERGQVADRMEPATQTFERQAGGPDASTPPTSHGPGQGEALRNVHADEAPQPQVVVVHQAPDPSTPRNVPAQGAGGAVRVNGVNAVATSSGGSSSAGSSSAGERSARDPGGEAREPAPSSPSISGTRAASRPNAGPTPVPAGAKHGGDGPATVESNSRPGPASVASPSGPPAHPGGESHSGGQSHSGGESRSGGLNGR